MHGELTAFLSAVCYAVSNLLIRKGQDDTHPTDNGLFPILVITGVILLFALGMDIIKTPIAFIQGAHWVQGLVFCTLSGILATLFGRLAFYRALSRIGATRGSIIVAMSPIVTLVLALTILGEKLDLRDIIGIVVLLSGIAVLILERRLLPMRYAPSFLIQNGIWIALSATLFQGVGYTFRKIGVEYPIDPAFAAALDTFAALFVYIVILGFRKRLKTYVRYYASHVNIYVVASGFAMAAAVFLFFRAVMQVPVSTVSVIMGSQPVIVALLAGIFMSRMEELTWATGVSAVFVSIGVVLLGI